MHLIEEDSAAAEAYHLHLSPGEERQRFRNEVFPMAPRLQPTCSMPRKPF